MTQNNIPRELGANIIVANRNPNPDRRPPVVGDRELWFEIDKENGVARIYLEHNEGLPSARLNSYRTPMRKGQIPERFVVQFTDGSFKIFRMWDNISTIADYYGLMVKTVYRVVV